MKRQTAKASPVWPAGEPMPGDGFTDAESPVISFPGGIPGFQTCRRFVVLAPKELAPLRCLNALDPPEPSFLVIDPLLVDPAYEFALRDFERARLGAPGDPLLWLAIVTVTPGGATVNLRAPVVLNLPRMVACQFIRDNSGYAVSLPLDEA
jgi:flagellar assembly factor FliW